MLDHPRKPRPDQRPLELYSVVTLMEPVECDGKTAPRGTTGVIVDIGRTPGVYEVEFTRPFAGVATVKRKQIA